MIRAEWPNSLTLIITKSNKDKTPVNQASLGLQLEYSSRVITLDVSHRSRLLCFHTVSQLPTNHCPLVAASKLNGRNYSNRLRCVCVCVCVILCSSLLLISYFSSTAQAAGPRTTLNMCEDVLQPFSVTHCSRELQQFMEKTIICHLLN